MKKYKSTSSFFVAGKHLNFAGTLFGGELMAMCDLEAAKIGREICYEKGADNSVTVSFYMNFKKPAIIGDLITLDAETTTFGTTSLSIDIKCTKTTREGIEFIGSATTTFVIIKDGKPFKHGIQ